MKKLIAIMLTLVMAQSLVACGNTRSNANARPGDDPQPAAKTTLVVGVSADYAPFEFMYPDASGNMVYGGIDISVAQ